MIISRIYGGLGNQLFQYAAARALAEKHGTVCKLDVTLFADYHLRNFDLAQLRLPFSIASADEIKNLKAFNSFQRIKARLTPYPLKRFYKEPHFHFDTSFFQLSKQVYIQGYFQSEKYFVPVKDKLLKEIDLVNLVSEPVQQKAGVLTGESSVSIHIRRGDYQKAETEKMHGILPLSYYQQAIAFFKQKNPAAKFYIFSDDPAVATNELGLPEAEVVSQVVTKNHFEDFYLMSHCRHNIIANSSFSWWAAWLNQNRDKTVVAPKVWFNLGPKDTQDLLPESWIKF